MNGKQILYHKLKKLCEECSTENIGDKLYEAIGLLSRIDNPNDLELAEIYMNDIRVYATRAEMGWKLFDNPIIPEKELSDEVVMQLFGAERMLHELCYGFDMVERAAQITSGGETPTRFYLNSIYNYIYALFIVDAKKSSHKKLPMGGTVIKVLFPISLEEWLIPIKNILDKTYGRKKFGESIANIRSDYLVHGELTPRNLDLPPQT